MTHIVRALAVPLIAILVAAGCAELPAGGSGQRACPPCADCPACPAPVRGPEAKYTPAAFSEIPGWTEARLAPGLAAFASGCARMAAGSALRRSCEAARAIAPGDEAAARRFVEERFAALAVSASDGIAEGLVTGYYEPV